MKKKVKLLERIEDFTPDECSGEISLQKYHNEVIELLFSRREELHLTLEQSNALAEIHSRIDLRVQELTELLKNYDVNKRKKEGSTV